MNLVLRIIDDRAFEELKWLNNLRLNDNNICKIEKHAFKVRIEIY